jgi:hypothetical protein
VVSFEEQGAFRFCGFVGYVAQARWQQSRKLHHHNDGAQQATASYPRQDASYLEARRLDVSGAPFDKAWSVLEPYPPQQMDAHDVSILVNKPENDTAECIQPLSGKETPTPQLSLL